MSLTVIIVQLLWIAASAYYSRSKTSALRIDNMRLVYTFIAISNIGGTLVWAVMISRRGDYPSFNLVPIFAIGLVCAVLALRSNTLYATSQGKSPA